MIEVLKQMVEALEWCHGGEPVGTADAIKAGKKLIAEWESQEPVAWMVWGENNVPSLTFTKPADKYVFDALYTHQPQRKPLTNDELYLMYNLPQSDAEMIEFARAIEAAHGIKEQS